MKGQNLRLKATGLIVVAAMILAGAAWKLQVVPVWEKATDCFREEALLTNDAADRLKLVESRSQRTEMFCVEDEKSVKRLMTCYETAVNQKPIGSYIVQNFTSAKKLMNDSISSHNRSCPDRLIPYL